MLVTQLIYSFSCSVALNKRPLNHCHSGSWCNNGRSSDNMLSYHQLLCHHLTNCNVPHISLDSFGHMKFLNNFSNVTTSGRINSTVLCVPLLYQNHPDHWRGMLIALSQQLSNIHEVYFVCRSTGLCGTSQILLMDLVIWYLHTIKHFTNSRTFTHHTQAYNSSIFIMYSLNFLALLPKLNWIFKYVILHCAHSVFDMH